MSLVEVERRSVPRVDVRLQGELASGNSLLQIEIVDLSTRGCGIEILDGLVPNASKLTATGVLNFTLPVAPDDFLALPVMISNGRIDGGKLRFGLRFPPLSDQQTAYLNAVFDHLNTIPAE
jgi:hypothetical protein